MRMMKPLMEKEGRDRFILKKAIIDGDTSGIDSLIVVISQDERKVIERVTHHLLTVTEHLSPKERERVINILLTPHLRGKKRRFK